MGAGASQECAVSGEQPSLEAALLLLTGRLMGAAEIRDGWARYDERTGRLPVFVKLHCFNFMRRVNCTALPKRGLQRAQHCGG